jgi:shikimate dehydrogenase
MTIPYNHAIMDSQTKVCAVIGNPVGHSLSPLVHNAAFQAKNLNFVYLAFPVKNVRAAIEAVRELGMRGLSVTIPHKETVVQYLDEIDPVARRMGSVNTVVNQDGHLFGTSTDGPGAMKALAEAGVDTRDASVVILGAGGAARALGFTLASKGGVSGIHIIALQAEKSRLDNLAREIHESSSIPVSAVTFEDREGFQSAVASADLLINCTPVGMHPGVDATPLPNEWHRPDLAVFDIVYTPRRTKLLRKAEEKGAKIVEGLEMFVHQAAIQFELWTGVEAPTDLMRRVLAEELGV